MEKICRYCRLEVAEDDPNIIRPCPCKSYLHVECLDNWYNTYPNSEYACEICRYAYKISSTTQRKYDWEVIKNSWLVLIQIIITFIAPFGDFSGLDSFDHINPFAHTVHFHRTAYFLVCYAGIGMIVIYYHTLINMILYIVRDDWSHVTYLMRRFFYCDENFNYMSWVDRREWIKREFFLQIETVTKIYLFYSVLVQILIVVFGVLGTLINYFNITPIIILINYLKELLVHLARGSKTNTPPFSIWHISFSVGVGAITQISWNVISYMAAHPLTSLLYHHSDKIIKKKYHNYQG